MNKYTYYALLIGCFATGFWSCEKDSGQLASFSEEGYFQLEIIVNPMIHTYAQTTTFNVSEVRIGDLLTDNLVPDETLQFDAGVEPERTQVGSHAILAPGGYANIELDLNTSLQDGCHMTTPTGVIDRLGAGVNTVFTLRTEGSFLIESGFTTKRVMLLDLNKLVTQSSEDRLDFTFRQNLISGKDIMLYDPKAVGRIRGQVNRTEASPRQTYRLVVYAYPVGSFKPSAELSNGFASAAISANVRRNDQFNFPVLPEGAYELVVAHYEDLDQDGVLEFKEFLQADADVRSDTRITRVSANTETSVDITLGGVIAD